MRDLSQVSKAQTCPPPWQSVVKPKLALGEACGRNLRVENKQTLDGKAQAFTSTAKELAHLPTERKGSCSLQNCRENWTMADKVSCATCYASRRATSAHAGAVSKRLPCKESGPKLQTSVDAILLVTLRATRCGFARYCEHLPGN